MQEPFGVKLNFTYDAVGHRLGVADSFGGVVTSAYDVLDRLQSRLYAGNNSELRIDFTYTVEGQVESISRYKNLAGTNKVATTSYTYDAAQRLVNLHHFDAANDNIANYTYDAHSRMTAQIRNGVTTPYTYDDTDQLTGDGTNNFSYDANGNRTNAGYTTGTDNRLTSDGTWNYSYDAEGNQTKKVRISDGLTWTYGYNHRNQLRWVERRTTDGGTLEQEVRFKYDAFGNRLQKKVDEDGDGEFDTVQRYAYDGWNPAKPSPLGNENWDVLFDLNAGNNLKTRYIRGDVVDELFARLGNNDNPFWYYLDHQGSIRDITNDKGKLKDSLTYDGFGNIISENNSDFRGRYAWTGREYDTEIELQYNRARYYDAKTGRWISQDPLGFEAGDSNLYRYILNRIQNQKDPAGLAFIAIGSQPITGIAGLVGARHFSLSYFNSEKQDNPPFNKEIITKILYDFLKKCGDLRKKGIGERSVELLRDKEWKAWAYTWKPLAFDPARRVWSVAPVSISYISYNSAEPDKFVPIIEGDPVTIEKKWNEIIDLAKNYSYAEHLTIKPTYREDSKGKHIKNWPSSVYVMEPKFLLGSNNSNTFVKHILAKIKLVGYTLPTGFHPGADLPSTAAEIARIQTNLQSWTEELQSLTAILP